jgi:hypothetical protein
MLKKVKVAVVTILILIVITVGIMVVYPYPFFGPFENSPVGAVGNCGPEYRFTANTKIESVDEFIQFLINHQYEGNLTSDYKPTINKLIPDHTPLNIQTHLNSLIDLDALKVNVTITASAAIFSDEKIYTLKINNQDFSDNWPWSLTIKMSENGHISIQHCAGI